MTLRDKRQVRRTKKYAPCLGMAARPLRSLTRLRGMSPRGSNPKVIGNGQAGLGTPSNRCNPRFPCPPRAPPPVPRLKLDRNRLLGMERNINDGMSEALKQARGNEALKKNIQTGATLREPLH